MLQKPLEIKVFFPLQIPKSAIFLISLFRLLPLIQTLIIFHFYDLQNIAHSQSMQTKKAEQEKILDRGSLGAKT